MRDEPYTERERGNTSKAKCNDDECIVELDAICFDPRMAMWRIGQSFVGKGNFGFTRRWWRKSTFRWMWRRIANQILRANQARSANIWVAASFDRMFQTLCYSVQALSLQKMAQNSAQHSICYTLFIEMKSHDFVARMGLCLFFRIFILMCSSLQGDTNGRSVAPHIFHVNTRHTKYMNECVIHWQAIVRHAKAHAHVQHITLMRVWCVRPKAKSIRCCRFRVLSREQERSAVAFNLFTQSPKHNNSHARFFSRFSGGRNSRRNCEGKRCDQLIIAQICDCGSAAIRMQSISQLLSRSHYLCLHLFAAEWTQLSDIVIHMQNTVYVL